MHKATRGDFPRPRGIRALCHGDVWAACPCTLLGRRGGEFVATMKFRSDEDVRMLIFAMWNHNCGTREIAAAFSCSTSTVYKAVRQHRDERRAAGKPLLTKRDLYKIRKLYRTMKKEGLIAP